MKGDQKILNQLKTSEQDLLFASEKTISNPTDTPILIIENYKNYNLLSMGGEYFALKRSLGDIDLAAISTDRMKQLIESKDILVSASFDSLQQTLDSLTQAFESESDTPTLVM